MGKKRKASTTIEHQLLETSDELAEPIRTKLDFHIKKFDKILVLHNSYVGYSFSEFVISLSTIMRFNKEHNIVFYYKNNSTNCFLSSADHTQRDSKFSYGECAIPTDVLNNLNEPSTFGLSWSQHNRDADTILITVFIKKKAVTNLRSATQQVRYCPGTNVRSVIEFFYNVKFEEPEIEMFDLEAPFDIPSKYIGNCYNSNENVIISHESLTYGLRPYQCQAVNFMLQREAGTSKEYDNEIHMLYIEIKLYNGFSIFFHKYYNFFVVQKFEPLAECRGGILADEMGTGKTLDVIACILLNPRKDTSNDEFRMSLVPEEMDDHTEVRVLTHQGAFECVCGRNNSYRERSVACINCGLIQHPECVLANPNVDEDQYVCPYCLVKFPEYAVKSRATLIVAPYNIIEQWEEEICKHVNDDSLKVLNYQGLWHNKFMPPADVADHDIVLIAYETLKKEINYTNVFYGNHKLRHAKKFRCLPTPLLAIQWWRVCLDEAQMFESCKTKASQIVLQLQSVNKWCISGTPIQQSYQDFFWYFLFLGYDPYSVRYWFSVLLWNPFCNGNRENFFSALRKILWRTQKMDVMSQMDVPPQEIIISELEFSPIERVYYEHVKQQRTKPARRILNEYAALGNEGKIIDKAEVAVLLKPLRKLHLSCNSITGITSRICTQAEMHDKMLKVKVVECSELHRKIISTFNGVAGASILMGEYDQAAHIYNKILNSVEEYKENIPTDTLQQIHALHNYCELMQDGRVSDENLDTCKRKLSRLTKHYLRNNETNVEIAYKNLRKHTIAAKGGLNYVFGINNYCWWFTFLGTLENTEGEAKFLERLVLTLTNAPGKTLPSLIPSDNRFSCTYGLKYWLSNVVRDLNITREILLKSVKKLRELTTEDVQQSISCHLRPDESDEDVRKCKLCEVDELFQEYEGKLFRFNEEPQSSDEEEEEEEEDVDNENKRLRRQTFETHRSRTHADSEVEICFKFFVAYCKSLPECSEFLQEGNKEVKIIEAYKKEFKALRNAWMKMSDMISAMDELEMAKMCLRVRQPDEEPKRPPVPYIIEEDQIHQYYRESLSTIVPLQRQFDIALGKVLYVKNLRNAYVGGDAVEKICPVCHEEFTNSWYVLQCGHCLCFQCCEIMTAHTKSILSCPVCRNPCKIEEMYHVDATQTGGEINVEGHFSTKMAAVMKCLLKLHREDPTAKTLVFSAWPKVLTILNQGLSENALQSICLFDKKFFFENVKAFRSSADINILLLPYEFGSKGLNLTEATNVILVEPSIIKAHMLQAIGRVHRIGQTKKSTVYIFYIKDTIDEKIYMLQQKDAGVNSKLTLHSNDLIYLYG